MGLLLSDMQLTFAKWMQTDSCFMPWSSVVACIPACLFLLFKSQYIYNCELQLQVRKKVMLV